MNTFELNNIYYSYDGVNDIISGMTCEFEQGKVYAIVGRSGAGKTTLLSLLSNLTKPTKGEILYNGKKISEISQYEYRNRYVGVIFQSYNLLPHLNALENVILSMDISKNKYENKKDRAKNLLASVGLRDELITRRILKLSGGEQQRVAIARTLAYDPAIILADEPTGNLDKATEDKIMDILCNLARDEKRCVIIVTHSSEVADRADVKISL